MRPGSLLYYLIIHSYLPLGAFIGFTKQQPDKQLNERSNPSYKKVVHHYKITSDTLQNNKHGYNFL